MTRRLRKLTRPKTGRERGAAAVIIGVSLVALLGATGLAVDLGNLQATRNRAGTAADSAALAAAQELSDGEVEADACAIAQSQVTANEPAAAMASCTTATASTGQTIITVQVTEPVAYFFASIVGFDSGNVTRTTSARYGPEGVHGARPFGLCMEALAALLGSWTPSDGTSVGPVEVPYTKDQPADCNSGATVPGNWGSLDFDGGSNDTPSQIDWIENGYDGTIYAGDAIEGNTGALSNSVAGALDTLVASGEEFPVPVFGSISGGSGGNATFDIIGFVTIQLTGYKVNGSSSSRHLDMVFHPSDWPGVECCDITGPSLEVYASGICAHSDDTDAC